MLRKPVSWSVSLSCPAFFQTRVPLPSPPPRGSASSPIDAADDRPVFHSIQPCQRSPPLFLTSVGVCVSYNTSSHIMASERFWQSPFTLTAPHLIFIALSTTCVAAWSGVHGAAIQAPLMPGLPLLKTNDPSPARSPLQDYEFTLRHVFHHGTHLYPDLHKRLDVKPESVQGAYTNQRGDDDEHGIGPFPAKSSLVKIERLSERKISDIELLLSAAREKGRPPQQPHEAWTMDEIPGPNVTDRGTVLNFALMAANAYDQTRDESEWEDAKPPFNLSSSFGWQGDGLRGHVFADKTNSTIVLSLKGTTPAVFDGAETTTNDKINDNLMFSCCCGQGGHYLWLKVCDCMTSTYTCNQTCTTQALKGKDRYYHASIELYGNVTELYPDANVWLAGHSLGGSVVSLLGLTFGLPVITFQAPGDALPASRLGLPTPPGYELNAHQTRQYTGAYHFGHTADPIFMGTCNAATSACTLGFYAMESVCHTGHRCVWDVVEDKKWRVSATTHSIRKSINDVYRAYDALPKCELDTECFDCQLWKYYRSNHSDSTTSSVSSSTTNTYTRTETCKTPGWWGCLDESTTSAGTKTRTSATTITTTTCSSYGWFGRCLDPITTTTTSTIVMPPATTTSDSSQAISSTSTCLTPGYFWGCRDKTSSAAMHEITAPPDFELR